MRVTWSCGSRGMLHNTHRMTVSDDFGNGPTFTSILSIYPLTMADSACTFTCRAKARPSLRGPNFGIISAEGEGKIRISVEGNQLTVPSQLKQPFQKL